MKHQYMTILFKKIIWARPRLSPFLGCRDAERRVSTHVGGVGLSAVLLARIPIRFVETRHALSLPAFPFRSLRGAASIPRASAYAGWLAVLSYIKPILIILFSLFSFTALHAQQEAMYTHYMDNTLGINPAYAGSRDALTITALHRSQWVDFEGAPRTQTLTAHSPVYTDAVNLGLSVYNDKIGPVHNTAVYIDYAFRFNLTEKSKLALGLKVGFDNYNFNLSALKLDTGNDPAFMVNDGVFSPNFGFGIYYNRENFYAGLSTPKLLENDYAYSVADNLSVEKRHYYLIAGGIIPLSSDIKLKPTGYVKAVQGAPIEVDLTASFLFYDRFLLGAMYRTGDAVGVLAGVYITQQLSVGYSFDWSFVNTTSKYNDGSHEIVITYDFIFKENKKIRSPRYFTAF